ncbi:Imidazolonepropionase [Fusobacterium sp. DD29]|uniref:amidohydrolase n=1 Tax=unclassified Fusobacterium TaxID=2648384 RepID=UPI001B8B2C16|nr:MULTISPECIES: amidohydrolase [unclassified Fusobacterium]MBR8701238.1 Imidazolonepropionase [Fusobacterium sp. DD45]MBR8711006.1 Imidazolonepropionase [Fusobacterium sp. DD28]MBR8748893.1 Imidazolonepropionase [Fusobacterium sp. DD29]MBR8751563.1 Imidazolonepropionase [Fusobacterium sp. DD26]MBR8761160.1 Imidazolonepropionase [Fusobacterium sp. DD25]
MIIIKGGRYLDVKNSKFLLGDIAIEKGKIKEIGENIKGENGDLVIDASGKIVTPGLVEAHCHLGLLGDSVGKENDDLNERSGAICPELRAIDAIDPMDKVFEEAYQGGVTSVATGPGSGNILGGQFAAIKTYGKRIDNMIIKEPIAMKCAFGENPKRFYGERGEKPTTRMAIASSLRDTLYKAKEYMMKKEAAGDNIYKLPPFNLSYEALIPVLKREIPLKAHAHKASDIFTAIRIAKEFNVKMTLDHSTDARAVIDELAKEKFDMIVGPSLGHRTKVELVNKSFKTAGELNRAGIKISITTDSPVIPLQHLPICAALAVKEGMDKFEAYKAITINPAEILGIDDKVGSIEVGKDADIVIWSGEPLDIMSSVEYTLINGEIVYKK